MSLSLEVGGEYDRTRLLRVLVGLQYTRTSASLEHGRFPSTRRGARGLPALRRTSCFGLEFLWR